MSSINFDNPWLLLLALPLVALFAVPFFIAVRKDNVNGHNIASGIIHVVMALIIAFVAAGTSIVTTVTETDVYVLADVSYSANRNLDTVDSYISDLGKSLPNHSRMGVICFGRDHQLLTRLGERVKSVKHNNVDDSATDIVGALEYAGSLFRNDVIKRIVLITDGKQTNESDPNALKRQVDALNDRKIHVDAIYLDDNISADAREVQLSGVRYTQSTCLNREERAAVTVNCSCPESRTVNGEKQPYEVEAVLTLYRDGDEYTKTSARLTRGTNTVNFTLPTDKQGTYDYEVRLACGEDENDKNNTLSFTQTVSGEMSVLLITTKTEDVGVIKNIYGENAEIDAYSYVQDPTIPCTVEELCKYDEIVLSDVNAAEIANSQMFLESLDTVVSMFGKSLVTFGDTYVQSDRGNLTALGNMLPVVYGKSGDDAKLYTLVVDTSRSMEFFGNLQRAKTAAVEVVNMLNDDDMVALVEFNGDAYPRFNPVPVGENRQRVIDRINSFTVRQSTDIGAGLTAAFNMMKDTSYGQKRVMLFSDGLNFSGDDSVGGTVQLMRAYGIYTSALDVGRGANADGASSSAKQLMTDIGETWGGGGYFDITTTENLDKVISGELSSTVNDSVGRNSFIYVKRRADDALKGIVDDERLSQMLEPESDYLKPLVNYLHATAKGSATTVLAAGYHVLINGVPKLIEEPLYSYWNYGNGRTASFTSALSGDWVRYFDEPVREKLYANILQTNTPEQKIDFPFLLDIMTDEGYASVTLTPETVRADAKTHIEVTSPDGETRTGSLAFGTSTFNYNFVTPDVGKYAVKITYVYGGRTFVAERTVNISYSSEYDSFTLYDAAVLHKMLGANGKVSENGKLKIENDEKEIGVYNLSLNLPLLIVCVVLYAVDIAVRKLKWEDIKSFFKRAKKVK
ncbi:MAG: VWA domain-containing protein [Clostridia bacterium]|nr:VWA domain-containing protein [Clostridia bacterium]